MTISPWILLLLAVPVLLLGEFLVRHVKILSRFNIPVPVAGGLVVALIFLGCNLAFTNKIQFETKVTERWWTWIVTPEAQWSADPAKDKPQAVQLPFLVAFFTCVGLNASWRLVRKGSFQVFLFLILSTVLALIQNVVGVSMAKLLHVSPLLGVMCGSVTLTGGHGTAMGFAQAFEKAGLPEAAVIGVAAATFGLVAGSLIGGPLGGKLIRGRNLQADVSKSVHLEQGQTGESGFISEVIALVKYGGKFVAHLLVLLFCIKVGAWVSYYIQKTGSSFPVYLGSMLLGLAIRNILDCTKNLRLDSEVVSLMDSVSLGIFLSVSMMGLNLFDLAGSALPIVAILVAQVMLMILFARYVTFNIMGRDYDAAVMAAGHCGFGLGATSNAIANMKALVGRFGAAPRAFLVVPIVGAFLIDVTNAFNINAFIDWFKTTPIIH
jgi:ESS family glutamate:Na+ symporter